MNDVSSNRNYEKEIYINCRVENYNNRNGKFTREVQQQIGAGRKRFRVVLSILV